MVHDLATVTEKVSSFAELDDVVLKTAVDSEGATLPEGSYGTIVAVHNHGEAFTVEFVTPFEALAPSSRKRSSPDVFAAALLDHPVTATQRPVIPTPWGDRFLYEGPLASPKGATYPVLSVWQQDTGGSEGRLVTARPI